MYSNGREHFIQVTPPYEYMSTLGSTAKPRATHSNIQTAQSSPSLVGSEPTMHLVSTLLSQHINPLCHYIKIVKCRRFTNNFIAYYVEIQCFKISKQVYNSFNCFTVFQVKDLQKG